MIRQGATLAGTGLVVGVIASLIFTRLLRTELYQTSPRDPLTYATAPLALMVVALIAAFFPPQLATRVDPVVALRSE